MNRLLIRDELGNAIPDVGTPPGHVITRRRVPEPLHEDHFDLLAACLELHGWNTGSSDTYLCLDKDAPRALYDKVKERVRKWTPNRYAFDECVLHLVQAVLRECENDLCGINLYGLLNRPTGSVGEPA